MQSAMINPNEAKELARGLFLLTFPSAAVWFDLAWATACEQVRLTSSDEESLNVLAMSGDDPQVERMAREFVILFEAFMHKFPIVKEELIMSLESSCKKHGKTEHMTKRLKRVVEEDFAQREATLVSHAQTGTFVEYLANGEHCPTALASETELRGLLKKRYDIIVDERPGVETVKVGAKAAQKYYSIAPHMLWMLWLVLTHVKTGEITFDEIAKTFRFGICKTEVRDARIYRYRTRLAEELLTGGLCGRIFLGGRQKVYPLSRDGWSFIWLRKTFDFKNSVLLHMIPSDELAESEASMG